MKFPPLAVTILLFLAMAAAGSVCFPGFLAPQVFLNLLIDNAMLCIAAVGMTFVILTGGIDLSVGALIALSTMISAYLVQNEHLPASLAIPVVLLCGSAFGLLQGWLIERFKLQPFLVTLAGMFLARGLAFLISTESISITDGQYVWLAQAHLALGGGSFVSVGALIALLVTAAGWWVSRATQFGRTAFAIGGSENAAILMGLPVKSTLIRVYVLSGFCSALAGVVVTFYMLSGYSLHGVGLELDAIAAVVIGGTLLGGGVGSLIGSFVGVMILGIIQTLIAFEGSLSSWWTRIAVGTLLLIFCLLQRITRTDTRA